MLNKREILIIIIGMFIINACNLDEKKEFNAEIEKLQQKQAGITKKNIDPYKKVRDEFFVEVLKLENRRKKASTLKTVYDPKNVYSISIPEPDDNFILNLPNNQQEFDELELPAPPEDAEIVEYEPVIISEEVIELEPEAFGTLGEIQGLAMEAKMTGNDTKLINYLKQNGLYELLKKKVSKYSINTRYLDRSELPDDDEGGHGGGSGGNDNANAVTIENLKSEEFIDGDVFVKYDKSSSNSSNQGNSSSGSNVINWLIPGHWGHSSFLDVEKRKKKDNYFLLSASNKTDQGGVKVGYDMVDGYWSEATEVGICRVKNQSQYRRRASIEYAKQFIGKPYGVLCERKSNDKFYCSKIVYRGWVISRSRIRAS